jgi:hypothetical protein
MRSPFTPHDPLAPCQPLDHIHSACNIEEDYEEIDFDITTLEPALPDYDISERPWLPGLQMPYVIFNAKLIDPRAGKVRENMTLHLAGGKIASVSPTTSRDHVLDFYHGKTKAMKIDAGGYYVCPGLIDCVFLSQHERYAEVLANYTRPCPSYGRPRQ